MTAETNDARTGGTVVRSFVRRFHSEILAEWKTLARTLPPARQMDALALVDHVPEMLDQIADLAEAISSDAPRDESFATARSHAIDRLQAGFDISAVVAELSMLRGCVLTVWVREHANADVLEMRALDLAIDHAVSVSVARYVEASEQRSKQIAAQSERALAKLESLLAASPVGIGFVDRELRYLRINEALAAANSKTVDDYIGKTVREVLPELASEIEPLLRKVLETGERITNLPVTASNGRALLANFFAVRSRSGDVSGVGAVVVDVTDERRAQEALRGEQLRLQSILDHSPAAIWVKDPDGRILLANRRLADALGHPYNEMIGHRSDEFLPPEIARQHRMHDETVIREQRALEVEELVPTAGGLRTFLSIKFLLPGDPPLVGGIATEITGRKKMEDELRVAVRTREDILAIVSHDLRNPLGTIQLSVSMLQALQDLDPRARRHIDMVQRSAMRIEALIEDLLDTANIRAGRLAVTTKRELVHAVVSEALDLLQPLADEKGVALVRSCNVDDLAFECDRARVLQVFANLIGNAIKFCRAGDSITVRCEPAGDDVQFCVADTGPGIRPEVLPHLFEAYWSGPDHVKRGSGLGLYITRGIIENHRGRIWVESTPGEGARFFFTLPIAK